MNARLKIFSACLPQPLAACAAVLGDRVLRLQDEPAAILKALYRCGQVEVTTANTGCRARVAADIGKLCLGPGGSGYLTQAEGLLTLQLRHWRMVLAVVAPVAEVPARSLLFFDDHGELVQQVTVTCAGFAFEELVCAMLHPEQHSLPLPSPALQGEALSVDICALEKDWASACDDDCFVRMLRDHGVRRGTAMRLVRDSYALAVQPASAISLLGMVAERGTPVSLTVPGAASQQRLYGRLCPLLWQQGALTFAVGNASLTLSPGVLQNAWRVRRRSDHGIRTSVELYDERDALVLAIADADPHQDQDSARWCNLLCDALLPQRALSDQPLAQRLVPSATALQ